MSSETPSPVSRTVPRFIAAACLAVLLLLTPQSAAALDVKGLRFGEHPGGKTRMVLELDQTADFRVFALAAPHRVIVDLPAFQWQASDIEKTGNVGIRGIRTGILQPGISRLVVEVGAPTAVRNAFLLPAASGQPTRLVVDYEAVPAARFDATKDVILGTLRTGEAAPSSAPPPPRTAGQAPAPVNPVRGKPVIMIDAGHGGQDPGAIGAGRIYEKNVTLAMAQELQRQLEATGRYTAKLTRSTDKFIKLSNRVKLARDAGADLFISLHADSIEKAGVRGASIYTLSDKASDAQTAKLAARENKADLIGGVDLSHEDKDVANILIDLTVRDTMNQSKFLANTMVGRLQSNGIKVLERPHRYAGFAVLKGPDIPAILVEMGFMSNDAEARALSTPEYRRKLASALKSGIDSYFERVQKNHKS